MSIRMFISKLCVLIATILVPLGANSAGEPMSFVLKLPWNALHEETRLAEGRYLVVIENFDEAQCDALLFSSQRPRAEKAIATIPGFCNTNDRTSDLAAVESFVTSNNRTLVVFFETPNHLTSETTTVMFTVNRDSLKK